MKDNNTIHYNELYWLYLGGFFLVLALPLLNLPPWFSPPDWGKTIVFRIIIAILAFLFTWQALSQKDSIRVNPLNPHQSVFLPFLLLVALFAIFFLATLFSLDIRFSLWGSPYRAGGFVNLAFCFVFSFLTFFVIKKKDWHKIWGFVIFIGILVSIIAVFQQFGLLKRYLVSTGSRPPSTIGGPTFLAVFLLFPSFLILSFGIQSKNIFKKIFYYFSFLLFILIIVFSTQSRGAIIGLTFGFLWFFFGYPKKSILIKTIAAIILMLGIGLVYYLNTNPPLPTFVKSNKFLIGVVVNRLLIKRGLEDPRISSWRVSLAALKARPIWGYGPENFSIGFDRYYDPSLPGIQKLPLYETTSWWDRAHNFIFDIGVTTGIPALMIYIALFVVLFWQLQKIKDAERHRNEPTITQTMMITHGIQATFFAYLTANFFSFDIFSTYLILFLLIGYSLHLISNQSSNETVNDEHGSMRIKRIYTNILKQRKIIVPGLFIFLLWFIWEFNIKPFRVNTKINIANLYVQNDKCEQGLIRMEKVLPERSFLDSYLRLKYIDFIKECAVKVPDKEAVLAQKGYELLKENIKARPSFTRNWLLLGEFTNFLMEKEVDPEKKKSLEEEANLYFQQAEKLSPKRQEVYTGWVKTDLLAGNYQKAIEKSQKCIDLNPKLGECYWLMGLSQIFAGEPVDKSQKNIDLALEKGFYAGPVSHFNQLAKAYGTVKNYPELAKVYEELIAVKPDNPQYHSQLAFIYKELGQYDKARLEALKALELLPEAKDEVDEFLRTLPQK